MATKTTTNLAAAGIVVIAGKTSAITAKDMVKRAAGHDALFAGENHFSRRRSSPPRSSAGGDILPRRQY
jgi:hypothetical protein